MNFSFVALFKELTFKIELFTYLVPVPVAVYFAFTTVSKYINDSSKGIAFVISFLIAASCNATAAITWRFFRLRKIAASLKKGTSSAEATKKMLLGQPRFEATLMVFRWVFGCIQGFAGTFFFAGIPAGVCVELSIVLLGLLVPLESAATYIMSEAAVAKVLENPPFDHVVIPEKTVRFHPYWLKIVWTVLSVVWLPYFMLSYLIYAERSGMIQITNPMTHILIMGGLIILPIAIMSYYLGRGVSRGLKTVYSQLRRVSEGDFEVTTAATTKDEFGAQAYVLNDVISRLRGLYENITELNATLESKVSHRTSELNETLSEIREIKKQQDGDYFLTSLLLHPLNGNFAQSEKIELVSFVRQKKTFEFRNRPSELGGDLIATYNVQLNDRRYIAFVNGDCMGKSMQGAGGAIVLGTVFKSFVNRTKFHARRDEIYPEQWLRECLLELQDVFTGFDGHMATSAIIGLIDEENGVVYMVNAEHPWSVLYRNGKASFLKEQTAMYKIGFPDAEKNMSINIVRLLPGDAIICGSDGRDDIILGGSNDMREINSDEAKFLISVEAGKADPALIFKELESSGNLIDDLSLMRISLKQGAQSYLDETSGAEEVDQARSFYQAGENAKAIAILAERVRSGEPTSRGIVRMLAQLYAQDKRYLEGLRICEEFCQNFPEENALLYVAAYCALRLGDRAKALDLSERLRLRAREHIENLLLLARLHGRRNSVRTRMLLNEILQLQPNNIKAASLLRQLDASGDTDLLSA
jgi:Stage II sporulation protein E (SpoIIE)